jgi:toxin FitB
MILLDTNVVSALMQSAPDPVVVEWLDRQPADIAGRLAAERRRAGRPVEIRDVQIAGITAARRARLATRNLRHFEGLGLALVDPWAAPPGG